MADSWQHALLKEYEVTLSTSKIVIFGEEFDCFSVIFVGSHNKHFTLYGRLWNCAIIVALLLAMSQHLSLVKSFYKDLENAFS